jgi:hypothetical protein
MDIEDREDLESNPFLQRLVIHVASHGTRTLVFGILTDYRRARAHAPRPHTLECVLS